MFLRLFSIIFLFLNTSLFSELFNEEFSLSETFSIKSVEDNEENNPLVDLTGMPNSMVGGCVNAITGSYSESATDMIVSGANPIRLVRSYNSNNLTTGSLQFSWAHNLSGAVVMMNGKDKRSAKLYHGSTCFGFDGKYKHSKLDFIEKQLCYGVTNSSSGLLSAKDNIKNIELRNSVLTSLCTFQYSKNEILHFNKGLTPDESLEIFYLKQHNFPNKCNYEYFYKGLLASTSLSRVISKGSSGQYLGEIDFAYSEKGKNYVMQAKSPEDDIVTYRFQKMKHSNAAKKARYILSEVESTIAPKQTYEYKLLHDTKDERLVKSSLPGGRVRGIEYYENGLYKVCGKIVSIKNKKDSSFGRVSALLAPIGTDSTLLPAFRFIYTLNKDKVSQKPIGGMTEVFDPYENRTIYVFSDEQRLEAVENYEKNGALYRKEIITWGQKDTSDYTLLKKREILDPVGTTLLSKEFQYDSRGNVLVEITSGDLTGSGACDSHRKYYSYTDNDQVCFEDDGVQQIKTTYYSGSDLIKTRYITQNSQILERYFFEYDANGTKILEIHDNGNNENINDFSNVTERHITRIQPTTMHPVGLPGIIEEKYLDMSTGYEVLLKKTVITYSKQGRQTKNDVFDANNQFAFCLEWGYDSQGNLLWEKDPIGNITEYKYDENNNRIYKRSAESDYSTNYNYDFSNRLISESQIYDNGTIFTQSFTFDLNGNKIRAIDIYGNITNYEYDEFNRLIKTFHSKVIRHDGSELAATEQLSYDRLNRLTSKVDSNGHITQVRYNAKNNPSSIIHSDGSEELHIYSIQGQLEKSILPNGTSILYDYDYKNRVIAKRSYSCDGTLISEQYWIYNAFQLLKEIDCNGIISEYFYDFSGKLVRGLKGDSETQFIYDSLGRKHETREKFSEENYRRTINFYDQLDRVVEERIEDNQNKVLSQKKYKYDVRGNITHTSLTSQNGVIQKSIEYDSNNLPKKIIHPNGETTHFFRDYHYRNIHGNIVRYEEEIDPLGNTIAKTYDERGNIAIEEYKSSLGIILRKVIYSYDGEANLISRLEDQIVENESRVETHFEYNARNQETTIIEAVGTAEQKITRKEFNSLAKVSKIIKPDGTEISYLYDAIGRLTNEIDSTGGFHYHYKYDANNNILSVLNSITDSLTIREYDEQNRVIKEILDNGVELNYEYDPLGRAKKVILPDGSSISSEYDARNLITLSRESTNQNYKFEYQYDVSGKLINIKLPYKKGDVSYSYDEALRLTDINSPYFSQHVPLKGYDACNRLVKYESIDSIGSLTHEYAYDSINQLISEHGVANHTYKYDSRFNRINKDEIGYENNVLNQLLSQGQTQYEYDRNGNRKSVFCDRSSFECKFDTLDRLIEVIDQDKKIKFEYDAFHRRMSKQVLVNKEGNWNEIYYEKYIYVTDIEIGTTDLNGKINQLKVFGPGPLKNSAALEIDDKIFIPIHDHRGSVMSLVDAKSGIVAETYRYSAYGEEQIYNSDGVEVKNSFNPWRFSGKRVDDETGWSYFGRRYYDPEVGRWIGPDPVWFEDGTNLYAYVQNSPIVFIDPNGLSHWAYDYIPSYETVAEFAVNCVLYAWKALRLERHHWESFRSVERTIEGKQYPGINISCGFGIFTTLDEAIKHAEQISEDWGGAQVKLYHNASHGPLDCIEYLLNYFGFKTDPVRRLSAGLKEDIDKADPNDIFYHECHSQGVTIARNAIYDLGPEYSKRIGIIGCCPGGYIDEDICMSVDYIASDMDLVPWLDFLGRFRNSHTTTVLSRHPEAEWFDHRFKSPTFRETLKTLAKEKLNEHGINYENL